MWYQKMVHGEARLIRSYVMLGIKLLENQRRDQSEFLMLTDFKSGEGVPVTVTVTDQAGNKTEKTQKLFIDSLAPTVSLTGQLII